MRNTQIGSILYNTLINEQKCNMSTVVGCQTEETKKLNIRSKWK